MVDEIMAGRADHEGLASLTCHELYPLGLVRPRVAEIGQAAELVYVHRVRVLAELAPPAAEPTEQLLARVGDLGRGSIGEDRAGLALEWDSTEPRYQRLPVVATVKVGFETRTQPMWCGDVGPVAGRHLRHRGLVFRCQRLQHRRLGDPPQPVEPRHVVGEQVVLDDAPVFGAVDLYDPVVVPVQQACPALGFTAVQVGGTLRLDNIGRYPQRNLAVGRASTCGLSTVAVLHDQVVAEVSRRPGTGVCDQRLLGGQFQLELITQERRQPILDFLGLGSWPGKSQQMIVGVAGVAKPPIGRIVGIPARYAAQLSA